MNRWRVESTDYDDFRLWFVFERARHGMWWRQRGEFHTHAEALAHADKMARTVEVVLPRESDHIQLTNQTCVYMHSNGGVSITKRAHYSHVGVPKADLKPFALALLAHHYKQEISNE